MLRYDPTKTDHTKFVQNKRKLPASAEESNKKRSKQNEAASEVTESATTIQETVQVSKDQFYRVSSNLTLSLQRNNPGEFSLLSMFGRPEAAEPAKQSMNTKAYKETLLATKAQKSIADMSHPFSYESSDAEDGDDGKDAAAAVKPVVAKKVETKNGKKTAVWHESFFIFARDDARFVGWFKNSFLNIYK